MTSNSEWQFKAKLYLLSTEEGGRRTPFRAGIYRPQFSIEAVDISTSCFVDRIEGKEEMRPGESGSIEARLLRPDVFAGLLQSGTQFTLREGRQVVGRGIIQEVR